MMRRTRPAVVLVLVSLLFTLGLSACGSNGGSSGGTVTLKFYHWIGADAGPVIQQIDQKFEAENPNIKIEFTTAPTDQYQTVIKTRLASGDVPDVFGVFPGAWLATYGAKPGYLVDLSNEPWAANLNAGAKGVSTYNGKVYALPMSQNVIGVVYRKDLFAKAGVTVPTNWDDFLAACQKLKAAGITPLALGIKDQWVDQLIPYAMAPTAIYSTDQTFDADMFAGKATFDSSPWKQMMQDYLSLNQQGFFNSGPLGTTYQQTQDLITTGKAAMVVNGNWILAPLEQADSSLQLGMFPLPYNQAGQKPWVAAAVGEEMGISATSKHIAEAKKFVAFWARPDIMKLYLNAKKAYPAQSNVTPDLDPAAAEMLPALNAGSYNFLDQKWPVGVQDVMLKDIQSVFGGTMTIDQMLKDMDTTFAAKKSTV
jgi:raffinose/stachyose/melibiose transport system substrate-binding protein